jgi:outer membrane protein insertion porin family
VRTAIAIVAILSVAATARAESRERPIVAFRVQGHTKVTERTARYLSHREIGDLVSEKDIPQLEQALQSSELFEKVTVTFEDSGDGVVIVATLEDKHSWIIAPTVYVLPSNKAFGIGFAENNFRGNNQKMLLYGQIGNSRSLFFGTFFDPSVRGTKWRTRYDLYAYRRLENEYLNPTNDPTSKQIGRTTTASYVGAGVLVGYAHAWWLVTDFRLRGGVVYLRDSHVGDPPNKVPLLRPGPDGRDVSAQLVVTADARGSRNGVTWGPYLQLSIDKTIPGLDEFGYAVGLLRAYYSWRLFSEHELELRGIVNAGYHLPFHEELTLGGESDLRGYNGDQFRGDVRTLFRVEYSVPIGTIKWFMFRGIGFWDTGYAGNHFLRHDDRNYLPTQPDGVGWWRNDVGVGLRIYVSSVVLPLLGLDFGYGIEGRSPEIYFEVGLTDF